MTKHITEARSESLDMTFEAAVNELENIVSQMESKQLPLQDTLAAFKRGTALLQHCQKTLAEVEQQVRILNEEGAGKSQELQPYQDHE